MFGEYGEYVITAICLLFVACVLASAYLFRKDGKEAQEEGRERNPVIKAFFITCMAICILILILAVAFVVLMSIAMFNM